MWEICLSDWNFVFGVDCGFFFVVCVVSIGYIYRGEFWFIFCSLGIELGLERGRKRGRF